MPRQRSRFVRVLRIRTRRFLARLDRNPPIWLRWVPSWGTSLLVHAVAVLLLALYLYSRPGMAGRDATIHADFPPQLTDNLTSLKNSDHSGDPFTIVKSPDSPSLSIGPAEPEVTTINQPSIPSLARFAPELASPELPPEPSTRNPKGRKTVGAAVHAEDMAAPFSGRQGLLKAQMVRREGGTVHSEKAVDDGLDWIVRHQRLDGGWSLNFHGQCQGTGCPPQASMESDTAATGLALLPLLGAGHIHTAKSRYQGNIRKGLDWLTSHQRPTGDLFIGGDRLAWLYSHAIGTMTLCEAFGLSGDPTLREPAQRALNFIVESQSTSTGGWRYAPGQPGDTSVFGWQMFAIRSARLAGLKVPRNVVKGCRAYLDLAAADDGKITYSYLPNGPASPVMTAEALLCRQYLGWPRNFPALVKGAGRVAANLEQSQERNIYYWYYATQLLHNMQNKDWERWNVRVRDGLVGMQAKGAGCDRGSWDPEHPQPDHWSRAGGGRLFLTSLSLLSLEVYYRYLPLYQPSEGDPPHADASPPAKPKQTASR